MNKMEIKSKGDKVVIRTVPDVTIKDYVKGQDLVYESPDSSSIELTIDKAKYYAFRIDSIDELQNDINLMDKWSDDCAEKLKIGIEREFFTDIFYTNLATNVSAYNRGATPGLISATSAYALGTVDGTELTIDNGGTNPGPVDVIMRAEAVLTEQDVPQDDGRWIILPTWMAYRLQSSDLRRADSMGYPANQDVLRNGKLGKLGQFTVYVSNNLPKDAGGIHIIPFGHKCAITWATQLTNTETHPNYQGFGKILKGLQVYGYKAIKPEALGVICAKPA